MSHPRSRPCVSVVIAAYNAARFLPETLDSALAQTYHPVDIVVVDDGSTDDTPAVLARYRAAITVVTQPNRGVSAARNAGIRAARAELIAFLDADDLWEPDKLARQVDFLAREPDVGVCYTNYSFFGEPVPYDTGFDEFRTRLGRLPRRDSPPDGWVLVPRVSLLEEFIARGPNPCLTSTVVVRRRALEIAGLFNDAYRRPGLEDNHLWLRLARHVAFGAVDRVLMRRRFCASKHGSPDDLDRWIFRETVGMLADLPRWVALSSREAVALRRRVATYHFSAGYLELTLGRVRDARPHFAASLRTAPSVRAAACVALTALPPAVVGPLRRGKQRASALAGALRAFATRAAVTP